MKDGVIVGAEMMVIGVGVDEAVRVGIAAVAAKGISVLVGFFANGVAIG